MSANNWTDCPWCKAKCDAEHTGPACDCGLDMMREDYEIGIRRGEFHVSFGAYCTCCKQQFIYEYKCTPTPRHE